MSATSQKKPDTEKSFLPAVYFQYLNQFLDSKVGQALNLRQWSEKIVYNGAYTAAKTGNYVSTVFKSNKEKPERLEPTKAADLFDLNYSEDQQMIYETLKQFAAKMRIAAEHTDEKFEVEPELLKEFNELNLNFLAVPESLGGMMSEKSTVTQMIIAETLAHGDVGQAFALLSPLSVVNALIQWGSPAQQLELIPGFLNDTPTLAAIAVNEPSPLFSPFELQSKAVKSGENYILTGTKNMVPLAAKAAFFLVAAETAEGPQIFIVPSNTPGLTITADRGMGLNAAELGQLELKDVSVHESALLGGGAGFSYTTFISYGKMGWSALAVGGCQAVLDYVIPYTNDRYAFGEPISHRQAVAFMISDIKIETDGMRLLTQRAAAKAEQGLDFQRESYLAHLQCSDKSMQIGSNGVQLLGGHGYCRDFPVQRWYRDLRAVSICYNGLHL